MATTATPRREQILTAAAGLFSERGYHATSVRDIAAETGILPGSLYAHIAGKEDLLHQTVTEAAGRFLERVGSVAESDRPAREKLRLAMRAHVRVVADHLREARVFLHEWRALSEPRREEVRDLRDRYEGLWDGIVAEGMRSGAFRRADPALVRILVLSAANWVYTWYDPRGPLSPEEVADAFADILLAGLARRPARRADGKAAAGRRKRRTP